jgi:hypothetical protein
MASTSRKRKNGRGTIRCAGRYVDEEGALVELADGTLLSIPQHAQRDVRRWEPSTEVLLTADRMTLYNLRTGASVKAGEVRE